MTMTTTKSTTEARRTAILNAARWCFLNFGFAKTSLEDIARRAGLSRTLLYRVFKDKEAIFTAVFAHWLVVRHPEAEKVAGGAGSPRERLFAVCRLMAIEPWSEMATAPMGTAFFDVCARLDPEIDAHHHQVALACVTTILGDAASAEVFLLALDGLLADKPPVPIFEERVRLLVARFAPDAAEVRGGSVHRDAS